MKVAYNGCFGGFSLSHLGLDSYAKKKGLELFWYRRDGYRLAVYSKLESVPVGSAGNHHAFTVDLGDSATEYPYDAYYSPDYDRADIDLIDLIEELGEAANGVCSELCIAEIPDGVAYEIDEYDGNESVVPPRQTW